MDQSTPMSQEEQPLESSCQNPPRGEKKMPGIRVKFKDSNQKFNPEYHEDSLQDKIALIFGHKEVVKDICFSKDKGYAYIELNKPEDIEQLMKHDLVFGRKHPPLLKEEIDLMEIKMPYLKICDLEDWMSEDIIKEHFEELTQESVQSVVVCDSETAIIKFTDPKVCLTLDSKIEIMGAEISSQVEYEIPSDIVEENLVLVMEPLSTKVPERVIQNQLNKYFMKHFSKSPIECKIVSKTAYLIFEDSAVVQHIISNPPDKSFSPGIKMSSVPASEAVPKKEETCEESDTSILNNFTDSPLDLSSSTAPKKLEENLTETKYSEDVTLGSSAIPLSSGVSPVGPIIPGLQLHSSEYTSNTMPNITLMTTSLPYHSMHPGLGYGQSTVNNSAFQSIHQPFTSIPSTEESTKKVLIEDVPSSKRNITQLEVYMTGLVKVPCSIKKYENSFIVTYEREIDFGQLKQKASIESFGSAKLSFCKLVPTDTILICNIPESIPNVDEYFIFHFEKYTGKDSIALLDKLPGNKAFIKFKTSQSVQQALAEECSKLGPVTLAISEYYDFMKVEVIDQAESSPLFDAEERKWEQITFEVKPLEALWLEGNLNDLNGKLVSLSARASMSKKQSCSCLEVTPLDGASSLENWAMDIEKIVTDSRSVFFEISLQIPESLKNEIFQRAQNESGPTLIVRQQNNTLILGGHNTQVKQLENNLKQYIIEFQVEKEEKEYPKRLVLFLYHHFNRNPLTTKVQYTFLYKEGKISVTGNQKGRQEFWDTVNIPMKQHLEKSCKVPTDLYHLLNTDKGHKKIDEILGLSLHNIVYCLDKTTEGCYIYFMSSTVNKDILKNKKSDFQNCFDNQTFGISKAQLQGCDDHRWKVFIQKLEKEHFVISTVNRDNSTISVTGEKIVVSDICNEISRFLIETVSVEDTISLNYHEWKVISLHSMQKVEAIKKDVKGATIHMPTIASNISGIKPTITIQGDPTAIENAKAKLQALQTEICHKEDKLNNVPAARQIVSRMQDKIRIMETECHVSIDISVIREPSKVQKRTVSRPHIVCRAILPNEIRIIVYHGDFTNHDHTVDTIINFVSLNPLDSDTNLKKLHALPNGSHLIDQFRSVMNSSFTGAGQIIKADKVGPLKCSQLWHVLLECWEQDKKFEAYFLEEFLKDIFDQANDSRTILLTPICSGPLNYPAKVFAEKTMNSLHSRNHPSLDLTVMVYVDSMSDATEFQKIFNNPSNSCRVPKQGTSPAPAKKKEKPAQAGQKQSSKRKSSHAAMKHEKFITIQKGDITKTKMDVLVNSTNKDLNLSNGMVSKILLKICGDDLQKECSQLAPLLPGEVTISSAKNLHCSSIFHIVLRPAKEKDAIKDFKKSMQMVLQKAYDLKIGSIAFPSLGVGNLGYLPKQSAEIICEVIMTFRNKYPKSSTKYDLVIYDSKVYDEFKETVDEMLSGNYELSAHVAQPPKPDTSLQSSSTNGSILLTVECSDISEETCDVITSTTTDKVSSTVTGVANAIMSKGGQDLQQRCHELVQNKLILGPGDIHMMDVGGFGRLRCKKLIHAHLPAKSKNSYYIIHQIVTKCVMEADKKGMKSIALPAFGLGSGGYGIQEVAEPVLVALTEIGSSNLKSIDTIKIIINDQQMYKDFYLFFTTFFKLESPGWLSTMTSYVFSKLGKTQPQPVDLSSIDPSVLDNLGTSLVYFNVYAPTLKICNEVTEKLVRLIKEQCVNQPIQNPIIKHLGELDLKSIQKLNLGGKVEVSIFQGISNIRITGEKTDVIQARMDITQILTDAEKIHTGLQNYDWKTIDGEDIETYSYEDSYVLERAYVKNTPNVKLVIDGVDCYINLSKFEETVSGKVRKIKRVEKIKHSVPSTWVTQQGVSCIDVPPSSKEYDDALQDFHSTIGQKVSIVSLKRVENHTVYIQHRSFLEAITQKYPHKDKVTIKQLFHGSKEASITPILNQGFNRNFAADANAAVYGCGVYFALQASYSARDQYSVPNSDGIKHMFICSMIIGEYTVGNSKMKVAPSLNSGSDLLYDTLVNDQNNPAIFVALTDGQAYPEYLVSFKLV